MTAYGLAAILAAWLIGGTIVALLIGQSIPKDYEDDE